MDASAIARDLRRLRRAEGLTQTALAAKAGISQQHLSLLERRPERAELRTLGRVLDALGQTLAFRPASSARLAAWDRFAGAELSIPNWTTPGADFRAVGEMAELFESRNGVQPFDAAGSRAAWKAWRGSLGRLR